VWAGRTRWGDPPRGPRGHDAHRRRTRLDQHGRHHADQDRAENRHDRHPAHRDRLAVEPAEGVAEIREVGEHLELVRHQHHAEEEQPEAEDRFAPAFDRLPFGERDDKPDRDGRQRQPGKIERDDLRGDRGPDVGAKNDADCLGEVEQPGVDEADDHHRRRARRLDHRGHQRSGQHGDDAVAGEELEDLLHVLSGDPLDAVAHQLHAEDEQRQPAEHGDDHAHRVEAEQTDFLIPDHEPLFGVGDADADAVDAGLLAELHFGFGDAVGSGHGFRRQDSGGGGRALGGRQKVEIDRNSGGRGAVRTDQFHRDRAGSDRAGVILLFVAGDLHSGDETQRDGFAGEVRGDDFEVLVAGGASGGDGDGDAAALIGFGDFRFDFQVGPVDRDEVHGRSGDRCAAAFAAEKPRFVRAEKLDPQRLRKCLAGEGALFGSIHDSDFVHRAVVGLSASGGEKEKSGEQQKSEIR